LKIQRKVLLVYKLYCYRMQIQVQFSSLNFKSNIKEHQDETTVIHSIGMSY